jgi:hypothetical protein
MTVEQALKLRIIIKTLILLGIASLLGVLCYFASSHETMPDYNNKHLLYTLASVGISIALLIYIAWKIRYFHNIFAKEWTGTIISVEREITRSHRAILCMDDLVVVVQLDGKKRKAKVRLPGAKVGRIVLKILVPIVGSNIELWQNCITKNKFGVAILLFI